MNRRSLFAGALAAAAARLLPFWSRNSPGLPAPQSPGYRCAACKGRGYSVHEARTTVWYSLEDEMPMTSFEFNECSCCRGTGFCK